MKKYFKSVGLHVPTIMLPRPDIDLSRWAVIACDQYTSQPEYWQRVADFVGDSPSTLNMILPEVYLDQQTDGRVAGINSGMQFCLDQGLLVAQPPGFIMVDRTTPHAHSRKGLVVALDLECYDYHAGSNSLIRASEGTIEERLPPRVSVRRDAPLELPHIMVLIDDPGCSVIEPLFEHVGNALYDTELMLDSGHIRGYALSDPGRIASVAQALERLATPAAMQQRYGEQCSPLLYAVGDGNHSLATAKSIWEAMKKNGCADAGSLDHSARYALVELVNLHDPGLIFEPIHRVLFTIAPDSLAEDMQEYFQQQGLQAHIKAADPAEAAAIAAETGSSALHRFGWTSAAASGIVEIEAPNQVCAAGSLQGFLDAYLQKEQQAEVDYVHGAEVVGDLGRQPGNAGFYLPAIAKQDLFRTILLEGALPRKTFSMGAAEEKRFYLESRLIK